MKKLLAALLATSFATVPMAHAAPQDAPAPSATAAQPWMNARLSPDQRTALLLKRMTLDEKVALLHGPMAMPFGPTMPMPKGAIGSAGYIAGNVGSASPPCRKATPALASPIR